MEFVSTNSVAPPKNLYPCLATISVHPHGDKSRRLSTSSRTSGGDRDDGEENVLKRIASGGRRKSDAAERRKSMSGAGLTGEGGVGGGAMGVPERGTWYWRVQAGVTDNALILLPLTQPPNPVLTTPPLPLSQAMPAHAAHSHGHSGEDEGLVDKVKNLFRRGSHQPVTTADQKAADQTAATTAGTGNDRVIDQTAGGEQLPSAKANSAGATNVNANAETGWPGMINGEKLQMIAVPVHTIEKGKVGLSGGKKGDGYHITIPVTSHFAAMVAGFSDSGPTTKSGVLKLEFDKDWIGAKAESELLHHQLTMILDSERAPAPQAPLQLGGNAHGTSHPAQVGVGSTGAVSGGEAASVGSGRKVPGEL